MQKPSPGYLVMLTTVFLMMGFIGSEAAAAEFPTGPIKIIVPFTPGGTSDLMMQRLTAIAPKFLPQPLVTVFRPGAAQTIGLGECSRAKPDGYTLCVAANTATLIKPHTEDVGYTLRSFSPVCQINEDAVFIFVRKEAPWKNFKEYMEDAKKRPNAITYGIASAGGLFHIIMGRLEVSTGAKFKMVPFSGAGPEINALLGGHIDSDINHYVAFQSHIQTGAIRALGVMSEKREPIMSDVPTLIEQGYNVVAVAWKGFLAPAQTPDPILTKLDKAFEQIVRDPAFQAATEKMGSKTQYRNRAEFTKFLNEEDRLMLDTLKKLGLARDK